MTIRNCQRVIYWRQEEILPLNRFHWLKLVAGFLHIQINLLSMLFNQFWGVADNVIFLNHYSGILKRKHIYKRLDNNNFYYMDEFFRVVIKAMVVTLCIHVAR